MDDEKPAKPNMHMMSSSREKPKSGLTREIQSKIGQQLRAQYDEVVEEGVPDRFAALLKQLDELPPRSSPAKNANGASGQGGGDDA